MFSDFSPPSELDGREEDVRSFVFQEEESQWSKDLLWILKFQEEDDWSMVQFQDVYGFRKLIRLADFINEASQGGIRSSRFYLTPEQKAPFYSLRMEDFSSIHLSSHPYGMDQLPIPYTRGAGYNMALSVETDMPDYIEGMAERQGFDLHSLESADPAVPYDVDDRSDWSTFLARKKD